MEGEEIFCMELTNGYIFRQIFEVYNQLIVSKIPIFLKESGVTIRASVTCPKTNKKILSDIEIFTDDIINYRINTDLTTIKKTANDTPCQIEKLNMNNIKSVLKSVSKQNSIKLSKNTESDDINLEIRGTDIDNTKILTSKYESTSFDISDFDDINEEPNIKLPMSQFCVVMKGMLRDCVSVVFMFYENGLVIEGKNDKGVVIKNNLWGRCKGDYKECCVSLSFIKALCKINSLTNHSIIKLFCNKNGFMKLNHKIADFGEHSIYIVSINNNNTTR